MKYVSGLDPCSHQTERDQLSTADWRLPTGVAFRDRDYADEYEYINFYLVPKYGDMGLARDWMNDASARLSLKVALKAMVNDGYDYDFILIDCPPDLSVLTDAAFIAAQNIFLAAQTQAISRDAVDSLWDQLESIEDNQDRDRDRGLTDEPVLRRRIVSEVFGFF